MSALKKDKFNLRLQKRVLDLIKEYNLIQEDDLIAVALSGGKDSVLTLHLLHKFQREFNFKIVAIAVDEGIKNYRQEGMEAAQINADLLGIDLIRKSFKEYFEFTLDEIYTHFKSACMPCGVFRRYILNKTAYEIGATKIATGHNLDDEIQSFLMSFARADLLKFSKFGPKLDIIHPRLVPRIKPLWNTKEKEVGTWAILNDMKVHFDECPYAGSSLRAKTKDFLNRAESIKPGTKKAILNSFIQSINIEKKSAQLVECEKCLEPSSLRICKACEMKEQILKH